MKNRKNQARGLASVSHLFLSGPEPQKEKVTILGAAKALGVSKGTIITYLNRGLLKRIKQDGDIYILMDEVKALGVSSGRNLRVTTSVQTSGENDRLAAGPDGKGGLKQPLPSFGRVETDRQHLIECKTALKSTEKELETLKCQVNNLKQNLDIHAGKLERTERILRKLPKKLQKRLLDVKNTANAYEEDLFQETESRLLVVEKELKRLRRPWWKEFFDHLQLRPERFRKTGVVLFGAFSLWAILIFLLWWLPLFQKQPPLPMNQRRTSGPGRTGCSD